MIDQSVADIARDAVRENRIRDIPGVLVDQPKMLIVGELAAALYALCPSADITYIALHMHGDSARCSVQCNSIDALAEDIVASGGNITTPAHTEESNDRRWRAVEGSVGGVIVQAIGEHVNLTPADKRKRTMRIRRQLRDGTADFNEMHALGMTALVGKEQHDE